MIESALRALLVASLVLGAGLGCTAATDTSNIIESTPVPTEVVVYPDAFLGDVLCDPRPGGMQSYVATLTDHGRACAAVDDVCGSPDDCCTGKCDDKGVCIGVDPAPEPAFALPSSLPTSCSQAVFFRYVVTDHAYTAVIDGYAASADELVPIDGVSSGTRSFALKSAPGVTKVPDWSSECQEPVVATLDTVVGVDVCEPLVATSTVTAIQVDPTAALGSLSCSDQGGTITRFDVLPEDLALPAQKNVSCATGVMPQPYAQAIMFGVEYGFVVEAYEAGDAPAWRTTCYAVAEYGLTAFAVCDHLAPIP